MYVCIWQIKKTSENSQQNVVYMYAAAPYKLRFINFILEMLKMLYTKGKVFECRYEMFI